MEHANTEAQAVFNLGWNNAIQMVLEVVSEMLDTGKFSSDTLEELANRIV